MHHGRSSILPTILALSLFLSSTPSLADTITDIQAESASTASEQAEPTSTGNDAAAASEPENAPIDATEKASEPTAVIPLTETTPEATPSSPSPLLPSSANDSASSDAPPKISPLSAQTDPSTLADPIPPTSAPNTQVSEPTAMALSSTPDTEVTEPDATGAPNIFFSELQIAGDGANDDFVELFNPGDDRVSLKGFELRRKTKSDTTATGSLFHAFSDTDGISPKGHFLWANKDGSAEFITFADAVSANKTSPALTADNSLALFAADKTMLDSATWGSGHSKPFSPTVTGNPDKNTSLVRDRKTLSWTISKCPTPTNSQGKTVDTATACGSPIPTPPVGTIILNELYPDPNVGENEWIELRNTSGTDVSLAGWRLKDASTSPGYVFPAGSSIVANGFLVIDAGISKIALNNTGVESLTLFFPDGSVADSFMYDGSEKGASYAKNEAGIFLLTHLPTKGAQNDFDPTTTTEPTPPVGTVRINEIFPNPKEKGEANEWIELRNSGFEPVSLRGWTLRSGSGKFTWTERFPEEQLVIPSAGFLVLPRSLTRLALRNTDGVVTLVAPDGMTTMDSVTYDKTTEGATYGLFESVRFRWSKTLTPGSDNVFGKEPKVKKSTIPKNGYRGTLVPFSATGNKKGMKYVWDFGDGHKSYLETTSHRFAKTGTYEGSLTLRDGIEETVKPFTIRIGTYPNRDIHLTELCPNPAGTDTDKEWARIRNDDTKRIDLSGWIIASATEKSKLVNHVILSDRSIGPGEEIVLTRVDSRFTLPNERAVIELRRPDGKAVQTIKYFQDGGATENAVFTQVDDSVWVWSVPEKETDIHVLSSTDDESESDDSEEADPFEAGMSAAPDSDRLTFGEFVSLGTPYDPVLPDSLPRVLGASDERLQGDASPSDSFLDSLFRLLNGLATGAI